MVAMFQLTRSLQRALLSPAHLKSSGRQTSRWNRADSSDRGDGDWSKVPSPQQSAPPWGSSNEDSGSGDDHYRGLIGNDRRSRTGSNGGSPGWSGATNNWASAVPLPRLALLSGLTALRLNASLAGIHVRVPSKGIVGNGHGYGLETLLEDRKGSPPSAQCPRGDAQEDARRSRARRCIWRIARQLVERIHPAENSPGFRQACRLFRDEMTTIGFDQLAVGAVLKALAETNARIRDPAGQDEGKDEEVMPSPPPPSTDVPEGMTCEPPGASVTTPEDHEDVRELIEAAMQALSTRSTNVSSGGVGAGGVDPLITDIISVEVGGGEETQGADDTVRRCFHHGIAL